MFTDKFTEAAISNPNNSEEAHASAKQRLDDMYERGEVDSAEAHAVDLVHVRPCMWRAEPLADDEIPPAVRHTFARGGRNWQRVNDDAAERALAAVWGALQG